MQFRIAVGLSVLIVAGQLSQFTRWLVMSQIFPPVVLLTLGLMTAVGGVLLWVQWLHWLNQQEPLNLRTRQIEQAYPPVMALLGIVLGTI